MGLVAVPRGDHHDVGQPPLPEDGPGCDGDRLGVLRPAGAGNLLGHRAAGDGSAPPGAARPREPQRRRESGAPKPGVRLTTVAGSAPGAGDSAQPMGSPRSLRSYRTASRDCSRMTSANRRVTEA